MSMTTFFQHSYTSQLPLPPVREKNLHIPDAPTPETAQEIVTRGLKTALSLLHHPETMISLNPLVVNFSRIPPTAEMQPRLVDLDRLANDFNVPLAPQLPSCADFADSQNGEFVHYEITDRFSFLFGSVSKLMQYRACFRPLYARGMGPSGAGSQSIGCETISDPGSGVALLATWAVTVDPQDPGHIVLTETVKVHCNMFMGWYVKSQLEGAHEQLHKEFGRRFVEKMVAEDPGIPPSWRARQQQLQQQQQQQRQQQQRQQQQPQQQQRQDVVSPMMTTDSERMSVERVNSGGSIKEGMKMRIEMGKSKKKEEDKNTPTSAGS